jgi:hypothetical protein
MKNLNYKKSATEFIRNNNIANIDDATGVVIAFYLDAVEFKTLHSFYPESNKYCYKTTKGEIGTLPMQTTDRITTEVLANA